MCSLAQCSLAGPLCSSINSKDHFHTSHKCDHIGNEQPLINLSYLLWCGVMCTLS